LDATLNPTMMNRSFIVAVVLALVAAVWATVAYLHGANIPVLEPQGPVASGELSVMYITLLLCAIIVVPVFVLLFWFAWKYRASNPETAKHHRPEWDHSSAWLEFSWWLAPTAIIAVLAVVAWQSAHALDPYVPLKGSNAPMTIQVVALDWKWLFIYPEEGIATVNYLEIPVNSPVHFELTADAPMNSFWIPALGGQIMVMPGMTTQLNLLASNAGVFNGVSGNISGAGFAGMTFAVHAVSESDFESWINGVKASSTPLTNAVYASLVAPSTYNAVAIYAPIDASLYTAITMKYMSAADMAATLAPTSASSNDMNGMNMPMGDAPMQ